MVMHHFKKHQLLA